MTSSSGLSIYDNPDNYDWTQSSSSDSEQELPQPKRPAMAAYYGQVEEFESEAATSQVLQVTPTKKSPRKRPEPTEGYIYGFILPFTVDNAEYYVVKIGKTGAGQVGRRLRDHHKEFIKATSIPVFLNESISAATPDEDIIKLVKRRIENTKMFLLSYIKDGLRAAESGARACIGVAPFNTGPTFKNVFPDSKRVTTTEWVVARKQVVEDIQVAFWNNELDTFDTADTFLEKLKELNKRKHIKLTISLESITSKIYHDEVTVPEYAKDSRS